MHNAESPRRLWRSRLSRTWRNRSCPILTVEGAAVALGIAFVSLEDGEQVEPVIRGQIQDSPGFAVLPDRRVILPDEAAGVPLVRTVEIDPGLRVQGEAGAQTATITCTTPLGAWQAVGSQDVDLTEDFTTRLRARTAGA